MPELQKTFKESYLNELKDKVKAGKGAHNYAGKYFEIDTSRVKRLANVYAPKNIADKLDPHNDFKSAVALHEAYNNITPLLATSEAFWAYLTHTTLFNYTQRRWPNVTNNTATSNYILDHWFVNGGDLLRNAAASLWWGAHLTVDEERHDKYELTKVLFSDYSFRINLFGSSFLIRHREAMIGILGFIKDNADEWNECFEPRGLFISQYFNRLGGTKQLSCLDRTFFYNECLRIKDNILKIKSRDDVYWRKKGKSLAEDRDPAVSAPNSPRLFENILGKIPFFKDVIRKTSEKKQKTSEKNGLSSKSKQD